MSDLNLVKLNLYKPNVIDLIVLLPNSWNAFDHDELDFIAKALIKGSTTHDIIIFILKNRTKNLKLPKNWLQLIEHETCFRELSPWMNGLIEKLDLTKQPLPVLKHFWGKRFGPDDQFKDLTCGEFEDVEKYFVKYCISKDIIQLRHVAEILWRKKKKGKRIAYDSSKSKLSSFSRTIVPFRLHILYLWYSSCRTVLPSLFKNLYEGEPPSKDQAPDLMVFTKLIHEGAGTKNGTRDQIRKTLLLEFLYECELSIIKAKEIEANTK